MQNRHEQKYIISSLDVEIIKSQISSIATLDTHVEKGDMYHIRSIYFDDIYNQALNDNIDGVLPREKWRIRTYNLSSNFICLECKSKIKDLINKKSCIISEELFQKIINNVQICIEDEMPVLLKRFLYIRTNRYMVPKIIVGYDRIPYVSKIGNVRITLDLNIYSSAPKVDSFFETNIVRRPILSMNQNLLEVKYDEMLPDYIYKTLQLNNMCHTTFSKYYLCRKFSVMGGAT